MIQVTPQLRILVTVEPIDFRAGIDGLYFTAEAVSPRHGLVFFDE